MEKIETLEKLNEILRVNENGKNEECILRVYDNKSDILLQTIVVKHPIIFIRGIQDFCKSVNLPVSDVSVQLVGYILEDNNLIEVCDICEISPYVYFQKPEKVETSKDA